MPPPEPPVRLERLTRLEPAAEQEVSGMVERAEVHERHSAIGEHSFLQLLEGEPDSFGLLVRDADERAVGYAQATRFARHDATPERLVVELLVDPERRGQGIGRQLLGAMIDEARGLRVQRFDAWAHHADLAAARLAAAYGMTVTRRLWQLALPLARVAPRHRLQPPPDRVVLRAYRPGEDEDGLVALIRSAFPDHPENAAFDRDDLAASAAQPWFDPAAILVAADASTGTLLGVHWVKIEPRTDTGEVYLLGVSPDAQGGGIGRVLLLAGLELMRQRAIRLAYLYVNDDNEAALQLYLDAGFRHQHLDTCYSLDLRQSRERRLPG